MIKVLQSAMATPPRYQVAPHVQCLTLATPQQAFARQEHLKCVQTTVLLKLDNLAVLAAELEELNPP